MYMTFLEQMSCIMCFSASLSFSALHSVPEILLTCKLGGNSYAEATWLKATWPRGNHRCSRSLQPNVPNGVFSMLPAFGILYLYDFMIMPFRHFLIMHAYKKQSRVMRITEACKWPSKQTCHQLGA